MTVPNSNHVSDVLRGGPLLVGIVGFLIGVALVSKVLVAAAWDPSGVAAFGVKDEATLDYAQERLDSVAARPSLGHDGRFYFVQANDPFMMDPEGNIDVVDRPIYRAQRMLYPLTAGLGGLLTPSQILWGLIGVNLLAMAAGAAALAIYARQLGLSPWFGLAFPLNPGLISELAIDGAGVMAFALVCGALAFMSSRNLAAGVVLLTAAALTREVMLLSALGLGTLYWLRGDRRIALLITGIPLAAVAGWAVYLRATLPRQPTIDVQELGVPLAGIWQSLPVWVQNPFHLLTGVGMIVGLGVLVAQMLRGRQDPLAWAAVGFAALTPLLTAQVWTAAFDIGRAVAPALTAVVVSPGLAAALESRKSHVKA